MFPRSQRISSALFDEVLKSGTSSRSPHFSLAVLKGLTLGGLTLRPRIAVIVSKKVAGKASWRNRLRRQARSWVKEYAAKTFPTKGITMVIFVNITWEGPFPVALQQELAKLLSSSL